MPKKEQENKDNKDDLYKERLKKIIGKKFDTTMIFPLSQFEAAFGHIFGAGKPIENLTDEERINRKKWNECRNNILNLGNAQKRNAYQELDCQNITPKKYQAVFIPKDRLNDMSDDELEGLDGFDIEDRFNR